MPEVTSVLLVGVGGQGTVLVTTILANGLAASGYDVKTAEVHGMAQRGGSVSTQVRYGEAVHSPIIGKGGADVLVAFEAMEALRWLEFLKPEGKVIVNDHHIPSAPILLGRVGYPEGVLDALASKADMTAIKASDIAAKLGNPKVQNLVLFGAMVECTGLADIDWEAVIRATVKKSTIDLNLAAYRAGRTAAGPAATPARLASGVARRDGLAPLPKENNR